MSQTLWQPLWLSALPVLPKAPINHISHCSQADHLWEGPPPLNITLTDPPKQLHPGFDTAVNIQIWWFHYDVSSLHEICVYWSQYLFLLYFWSLSNTRLICHLHLHILKNLKLGPDWAHLLHCVCLKSQLSSLFSNLFSPWLTFPSAPLQQMKEQSLNLLLSASHLDHKNSCSEHANQYPPILRSAAQDSQQ